MGNAHILVMRYQTLQSQIIEMLRLLVPLAHQFSHKYMYVYSIILPYARPTYPAQCSWSCNIMSTFHFHVSSMECKYKMFSWKPYLPSYSHLIITSQFIHKTHGGFLFCVCQIVFVCAVRIKVVTVCCHGS